MRIQTRRNIGQRLAAVLALFAILAVSVALRTPSASAQSPYQYGYPSSSLFSASYGYGSSYGSSYPYSSYGSGYGSSYPYSSYGSSYGSAYSTYGSTYPSTTTTTTYASAYTPTYSLSGSYCTPSGGTGEIWVPAGASAASMGC
jgi:hypothetical protein